MRPVQRGLTIGLAIAALGVTISLVTADSSHEAATAADAVPAYQVMTTLREMGFEPNREPVRRGPYYVLHATDRRGVEMRVVADAHFGDIISVAPARPSYAVNYSRGPRIIHVPQPDEIRDGGEFDNDAVEDESVEAAPPPPAPRAKAPPRRVEPKQQRRSDAPRTSKQTASAPPVERRTVLSAPPPPPKAMSPIYPTPRFDAQDDPRAKFETPRTRALPGEVETGSPSGNAINQSAETMPPPPGYESPSMPAEN